MRILALALSAFAASAGGGIAFHPVARGAPGGERPAGPRVYLATSKSQIAAFGSLLPAAARASVGSLPLATRTVVAVFLGSKPTAGYELTVRRVTVAGASMRIEVDVRAPDPDEVVAQVLTSPFHVVWVARSALPARLPTAWTLVDGGGKILAAGSFRR